MKICPVCATKEGIKFSRIARYQGARRGKCEGGCGYENCYVIEVEMENAKLKGPFRKILMENEANVIINPMSCINRPIYHFTPRTFKDFRMEEFNLESKMYLNSLNKLGMVDMETVLSNDNTLNVIVNAYIRAGSTSPIHFNAMFLALEKTIALIGGHLKYAIPDFNYKFENIETKDHTNLLINRVFKDQDMVRIQGLKLP